MDKKLTAEQYYKWRFFINQMWLEETRLKESELKLALMEKDLEISRLKAHLFKLNTIGNLKEKLALSKEEYEKLKKEYEDSLGISLNSCVIDDVTFEIRKIEE